MLKLPPLVTRKSNQQAVKNATEAWAAENLYCPKCLGKLAVLKANVEVKDFDCLKCKETYQLKARKTSIGKTITGADYFCMRQAIVGNTHPSIFLLQYDPKTGFVLNVLAIHKHCISVSCLKKNKSPVKGRPGKYLSKFLLPKILRSGRVPIVSFGNEIPKKTVKRLWADAESISEVMSSYRHGWKRELVLYIDQLGTSFRTEDAYGCAARLKRKFPNNKTVKEKIRQVLRDLMREGLIRSTRREHYER